MALQKDYAWKGYTPQYWKIASFQVDSSKNITTVWLSLYKDDAQRQADVTSWVLQKQFILNGLFEGRPACYGELKILEFFSGSSDV